MVSPNAPPQNGRKPGECLYHLYSGRKSPEIMMSIDADRSKAPAIQLLYRLRTSRVV